MKRIYVCMTNEPSGEKKKRRQKAPNLFRATINLSSLAADAATTASFYSLKKNTTIQQSENSMINFEGILFNLSRIFLRFMETLFIFQWNSKISFSPKNPQKKRKKSCNWKFSTQCKYVCEIWWMEIKTFPCIWDDTKK